MSAVLVGPRSHTDIKSVEYCAAWARHRSVTWNAYLINLELFLNLEFGYVP